jgi:tetratricopeptide (TPR) repeat protein
LFVPFIQVKCHLLTLYRYFYEAGVYNEVNRLCETVDSFVDVEEDEITAFARGARAGVHFHQNEPEQAIQLWQKNIELNLRIYGANAADHHTVSNNLGNIAEAYGELQNFDLSMRYFKEAKEHRERTRPQDIDWLAMIDTDKSCFLMMMSKLEEADETLDQSLKRIIEHYGLESAAYARCVKRFKNYRSCKANFECRALSLLGRLRHLQGADQESLLIYTKVLTIRQKIMPNHMFTCLSMYDLARAMARLGDIKSAMLVSLLNQGKPKINQSCRTMLEESITRFRNRVEARPQMARALYNISELCAHEHQSSRAETFRKEARSLLQEVTGKAEENDNSASYEALIPYRNR